MLVFDIAILVANLLFQINLGRKMYDNFKAATAANEVGIYAMAMLTGLSMVVVSLWITLAGITLIETSRQVIPLPEDMPEAVAGSGVTLATLQGLLLWYWHLRYLITTNNKNSHEKELHQ